MRLRLFLALLACLLSSVTSAVESRTAEPSVLADDPLWLALLHFNRGATVHSRGETYVDDESFFLSETGAVDPLAELQANISAMRAQGSEVRCRFPARYQFLARKLGWAESDGLAHCAELQEWLGQIPDKRVVLVFPASYLNSPSSMFGHTLIRLDDAENPDSVWHSWAVNFGAAVGPEDNSILYVYRGLAGGYPGRFVIVPYATKIQEYSHLENRDIWEYTLDLSPAQIRRMILHLWELRDVNFDYYFFDENCSYRLLELIDVVEPGMTLVDGFRLAEPPVNTVRALYKKELVRERVYRPSKAAQLDAERQAMDAGQQKLVKRLMADPSVAKGPVFSAYDEAERHRMALLAYQVLRFRHRNDERDPEVAARSLALLKVVNANAYEGELTVPTPVPPERGHGTQMLSLGAGQLESQDFGELGYRFTYHDLIDRDTGFLRGAQIEGIDLHLRSTESDDLKLESADIVHIRSLSPRNRLIKPISWFVHGGLERALAGERKRLVRFVQGGPGVTWQAGNFMPYGFLTARLENNSAYSSFLEPGGGAQAGLLWYLPRAQVNAGGEGYYFANDEYRHRQFLRINVPLGRQSAIRAEWQRDGWRGDNDKGFSLTWRQFFN